jgi:DNA-binding IclR family transcriptional regulator
VAAPVRGPDGRVCAALSVSAPNVVVSAEELLRMRPLVLRTAEAVGAELSGVTPSRPVSAAAPPTEGAT